MNIRDVYIRLVGKIAHITSRGTQNTVRVIVDYHRELDGVLELIYNIGEAANIAPLKGVVGIARLVIGTVKSMEDLCDGITQLMHTIMNHLKSISSALNPDILRRLTSGHQAYHHLIALLTQYQDGLRQIWTELQRLTEKNHSIWRQTRKSARLFALQQALGETVQNFQTQCILVITINTCISTSNVDENATSNDQGRGVPTVRHISDVVYRRGVQGQGFFAGTYVADVVNIGECLVKRVPKSQADQCLRLLDEMDERRHPALPQLRATLKLPKSGELMLFFHSIGHEYLEIGFALGVGNDFWPGNARGFYREMFYSWDSAEQFLRNSNFTLTPVMVQTALVNCRGQLMFAFPEHNTEGDMEPLDQIQQENTSRSSLEVATGLAIVLTYKEIKTRIDYLSKQDACPTNDAIRAARNSELQIESDYEVISRSDESAERLEGTTPAADVFAYGRMYFAICTRRPPFAGVPDRRVGLLAATGVYSPRPTRADCGDHPMSDTFWNLIGQVW